MAGRAPISSFSRGELERLELDYTQRFDRRTVKWTQTFIVILFNQRYIFFNQTRLMFLFYRKNMIVTRFALLKSAKLSN